MCLIIIFKKSPSESTASPMARPRVSDRLRCWFRRKNLLHMNLLPKEDRTDAGRKALDVEETENPPPYEIDSVESEISL